jgi:hypothetical protein
MADGPPRIATRIEIAHAFVALALIVDAVPLWSRHPLMATETVLGALAIVSLVVRRMSTKISDAGISQLSWRGRVDLPWDGITTVTRRPRQIIVAGESGRVVLPIESYYDSGDAVRYIDSRLPARLRGA